MILSENPGLRVRAPVNEDAIKVNNCIDAENNAGLKFGGGKFIGVDFRWVLQGTHHKIQT